VTVPILTSLHPKNHATVLVACKRIEDLLKKMPSFTGKATPATKSAKPEQYSPSLKTASKNRKPKTEAWWQM